MLVEGYNHDSAKSKSIQHQTLLYAGVWPHQTHALRPPVTHNPRPLIPAAA